jgi:hypothetical protein
MQENEQEWHVRAFRSGDAQKVASLYEEVYQRPLDPAFYHWKLHTQKAHSGVSNVWVAERDKELVGHYGGTPRRFWLRGKTVSARHTSDAMTSPSWTKQGVYSGVATTAHAAWATAGESFLFGLPNDKWGSRVAYLNYRRVFPAAWLRRPLLSHQAIAERFRLSGALLWPVKGAARLAQSRWDRSLYRAEDGVAVESVDHPGSEFDELWENLGGLYEALVVRDLAWVTYRYVDVPSCDYQLFLARRSGHPVGYLALRLTEGSHGPTGWILDIFTAPDDEGSRAVLLLAALSALNEARASSVRVLLPPGTQLYGQLRDSGFSTVTGEFGCHVVPLAWTDPLPLFFDPGRWFTMAGDYDII